MSEEYVEGVFNSCKNVITPSSGALAMDFGCGRLGAKHCTAKKWVCSHQYFVEHSEFMMHVKMASVRFSNRISKKNLLVFRLFDPNSEIRINSNPRLGPIVIER